MPRLKDCFVLKDVKGHSFLTGLVVEDARFEVGHRIFTSKIMDGDVEPGVRDSESAYRTYSGTCYIAENFIDRATFQAEIERKPHYHMGMLAVYLSANGFSV